MDAPRALYEQVILEHNRNPRNFGPMPDADIALEGYNPLCGDRFTLYLRLDGDVIADIRFDGSGCAIAKSSASLMTTMLKGLTIAQAEALFTRFHSMVTSEPGSPIDEQPLGRLCVFAGVREFPVRVKCVTLPWHTMLGALDGKRGAVSTE